MAPRLSMREIRKRAAKFASDWADETYEKGESQTFWNEFLEIFGIARRRVAFFEKRADRFTTKGHGFIDMFWPGVLLVEQKSAGKDLDVANDQAYDYLDSLTDDEFPSAVVVSDFARIKLTRFDNAHPVSEIIQTKDLAKEIDRFTFLAGYVRRDFTRAQEKAVNAKAVKLMGNLYSTIQADHYSDHDTSVFMTRILFLLFGDDTGLWARGLFYDLVERSAEDGDTLGGILDTLFSTLNKEERSSKLNEDIAAFPYVNGGLFEERIDIPVFDSEMRKALLACCAFDWSAVNPAVFGSMFQVVKSKADRRALGEHYTTEENILKAVNPLFLDDLREQVSKAGSNVERLKTLQKQLGEIRVLDPSCGCGNFLVVTYREMRMLELDILRKIHAHTGDQVLGGYDVASELQVKQSSFGGIELEEWPARIASTAMFLVNHQMNLVLSQEFGTAPDLLPISDAAKIVVGNALRTDWRQVFEPSDNLRIVGNPAFVGMARMTESQQEDNRIAFKLLPEAAGQRTGRLDYVACWYAKAIDYTRGTSARIAFVSTNSVTQGDQARALDPIVRAAGYSIDFGHRTFRWTSEAANAAVVHCVIVGFSKAGTVKTKRLFEYEDISGHPTEVPAKHLNFYLIDSDQPAPIKRTRPFVPGLPKMSKGSQPTDGRNLIVTPEQYNEVSADPTASKFLRPFMQSVNMLQGQKRWCLWLEGATPSDLATPLIKQRLAKVSAARLASDTESVKKYAQFPWLFTQRRQPTQRYLAVPEVSSDNRDYVPMRFYENDVIAGNKLIVIDGCPLWLFGYLTSAAFMSWVKTFAGRLKSDPSISPDLTYCAFPMLPLDEKTQAAVETAAQAVLDARDQYSGETLARLYDPLTMPKPLRDAHARLDKLIDGIYGLKSPTEARRAEVLLAKHHELVNAELLVTPGPKPKAQRLKKKDDVAETSAESVLIDV